MNITAVRRALADAMATVTTVPDLHTYAFVPDTVTEPCAFVAEVDVEFDRAMSRGQDALDITIRVLVGLSDDQGAAELLDSLLAASGPTSIRAALDAARGAPGQPALGGAADDLHVQRARAHRYVTHADVTYLGADIEIRVIGGGA